MGMAARGTGAESMSRSTVEAGDCQRGDELRHPRAGECDIEHLTDGAGADGLYPRQSGAVFDHQAAGVDARRRKPLGEHAGARGDTVRDAAGAGAEGCHQQPRLYVVGPFVHVPRDLGQCRRTVHRQRHRLRRGDAIEDASGQATAQFLPHAGHGRPRILVRRHRRNVPFALAAFVPPLAADPDHRTVARLDQLDVEPVVPLAAAAGCGRQSRHHGDAIERRIGCQAGRATGRGRHEAQPQCGEVDHQRIGTDVVGARALAVERPGIVRRQAPRAAIHHDVALDFAHPLLPQAAQQAPQALQGQRRITFADQVEIAVENAIDRCLVGEHAGLPGMRRAEHVEGGEGGDQLHDRRRIHRAVDIVGDLRRVAADPADPDRDRFLGNVDLGQFVGHRRRQCRAGLLPFQDAKARQHHREGPAEANRQGRLDRMLHGNEDDSRWVKLCAQP